MKHRCSICGKTFEFDYEKGGKLPPNFPFCSSRCKAIDLGKWLNEEYRINTPSPNPQMMTEAEEEALAQFLMAAGEVDEIFNEEKEQKRRSNARRGSE